MEVYFEVFFFTLHILQAFPPKTDCKAGDCNVFLFSLFWLTAPSVLPKLHLQYRYTI